jgi:hypothetical protein
MLIRCKSSPGHSWQNLRYARDDSGYDYHKFNTTGPICGLTDIVASYTSVQDVCNGPTAPLSPCTDTNDQCKKGSCLVHVGHVDRVYIVSYTRAVRSDALTADNDPKFACTCHGYDCSTTTTNMSTTLTATSTGTGAGGSQSRTSSAVDTVTPTTQPSYARYHKVNTRAIAGGTIGGMIFLALVIILFWFLRQRRHRAPASAEVSRPMFPSSIRPNHLPFTVSGNGPRTRHANAYVGEDTFARRRTTRIPRTGLAA